MSVQFVVVRHDFIEDQKPKVATLSKKIIHSLQSGYMHLNKINGYIITLAVWNFLLDNIFPILRVISSVHQLSFLFRLLLSLNIFSFLSTFSPFPFHRPVLLSATLLSFLPPIVMNVSTRIFDNAIKYWNGTLIKSIVR